MSDESASPGRIPLPVALLTLAVFFGAMKFEAFQPIGARAVGVLLPLGVVYAGVAKLNDTHPTLRSATRLLGLAVIVASELPTARLFFHFEPLVLGVTTLRCLLVALGLVSALLEGIAARRSLRARLTAWLGIALGFAGYLAGFREMEPNRQLGLILVAFVIGLWGGGLGGWMLGALAAKLGRGSAAALASSSATPTKPS